MPLIYLVIGQRLGLPVRLVAVGKHYFTRWQEPDYRMSIETTIVERVAVTPDESVYLETEGLAPFLTLLLALSRGEPLNDAIWKTHSCTND